MKLTAPEGVKAELRRGLAWHEEGHSGDGLQPETVAWACRVGIVGRRSGCRVVRQDCKAL